MKLDLSMSVLFAHTVLRTLPQKKWTLGYSNHVGQCTLASLIGLAQSSSKYRLCTMARILTS